MVADDFSLNLDNLEETIEAIDDVAEQAKSDRRFLVGTAVEYSIFIEVGTEDKDPRPFFRPALQEVRSKGVAPFVAENTETTVRAKFETGGMDAVLTTLALALERRIKEIITTKRIIDTGTLRASVLAIPGDDPRGLPDASEFSGFDSDHVAPPSAGRALAKETLEVNVD